MTKAGYGSFEYWERLYAGARGSDEWVQGWGVLRGVVEKHVPREASVLHLGCGNSRLGEEMYDCGWRTEVCIDYSPAVIAQMTERARDRPGLAFRVMDALALRFDAAAFDAVIEKGTLDAVACRDDGEEAIGRVCAEVRRVLRAGGVFISVSLRAPDARRHLLDRAEHAWRVEAMPIPKQRVVEGLHPELANNWVYVIHG